MADEERHKSTCELSTSFTTSSTSKNKKRKKKKQKVHRPVTSSESQNRKDNKIINTYHALKKKLEAVNSNERLSEEQKGTKSEEIKAKIHKLGGLDAYQRASKLGEKRHGGFNTSKWVVTQLREQNVKAEFAPLQFGDKKLKLLDVGALDHNYRKQRWIDCTPIDLNPQNSSIRKMDFLKLELQVLYHVIVLSLVINFEGDPLKRGEMLKKCTNLLAPGGYAILVLPLPCLKNSRFFSEEVLQSMLGSLGLTLISQHSTKRLYFAMFKKSGDTSIKPFPRKTIRKGGSYNNFSIVLS